VVVSDVSCRCLSVPYLPGLISTYHGPPPTTNHAAVNRRQGNVRHLPPVPLVALLVRLGDHWPNGRGRPIGLALEHRHHTTGSNMMCINFFVTPVYPNKCTRRAAHF